MAQKTDAELTTDASVISNETAENANTASRVGAMLVSLIDSKVNNILLLNQQTVSYTLALTDKNKIVELSSAVGVNLTVPPNSSVAFPVGSIIYLRRTGVGLMTVVQGSGVTVTATSLSLTDAGLNVILTLRKTGTDTWDLQNGISAPGVWTTWTSNPTGFSSITVNVCRYMQLGKMVIAFMSIRGVSNATTITLTGPVTAAAVVSTQYVIANTVNATTVSAVGLIGILSNSTSITVQKDILGNAFTASGTKGLDATLIYEAL